MVINVNANFCKWLKHLTEVSASNNTIVDTLSRTNANTSQVSKAAILIINLEKKTTSRFNGLDNELLNLKYVISEKR